MPSSWRTRLSGGYRSSPHPTRLPPGPKRLPPPNALTRVKRRASTRASSRSLRRVAIATGSTCATSPSRHVSCAAASPRIPTTWASPSPAHSAARSAMNSRSRSVAGITGRCIAHATSAAGGGTPPSTRSKLPAGSGRRRTEWDRGDLDEKYHLGRKALPRPLIQGARTSAPLRPRKRNPVYRIFPDKRTRSGWMLEGSTMTMWRPNEPAEGDVSNLPGVDLKDRRRRSHRGVWRHGLADQTVVKDFEDARFYRAFARALVGSVDPRSLLELALVHRLASLLWRL